MVNSLSTSYDAVALPYLTFRLGEQHYALAIREVVEVVAMVEPIPLASAPPGVMGIANRHGEPILLLNLRFVLSDADKSTAHQPAGAISAKSLFIVVQPESMSRLGIVVDVVEQVEYFAPAERTRLPHQNHSLIEAVLSVEQRMIQIINLSHLIQAVFGHDGADAVSQQNGNAPFGVPTAIPSFDRQNDSHERK